MFRMVRNVINSGTSLRRFALDGIRARLPASWSVEIKPKPTRGNSRSDAVLRVRAPGGDRTDLAVEERRSLDPKDVPGIQDRSRRAGSESVLVLVPFLSPWTRERLAEAGLSYADATGNLRLCLDTPPVFIETEGAAKNPWREPRPLASLKGPSAARVVRGLIDIRPPFGIRELAGRAGVSLASTARVAGLLDREGLVVREGRGRIGRVDWAALIRRWAQDYSVFESSRSIKYLDPLGLQAFLKKLRATTGTYAVTGSLAAARRTNAASPRLAVVYARECEDLAESLELRPAESGANVIVVEPFGDVVFERTWSDEGVRYAAHSQVAADLLTSPGRGPAEAEELIRWMGANENAWRV